MGLKRIDKLDMARRMVQTLYRDFDLATLEEMLDIGRRSASTFDRVPDEMVFLNDALTQEIERRKAAA